MKNLVNNTRDTLLYYLQRILDNYLLTKRPDTMQPSIIL